MSATNGTGEPFYVSNSTLSNWASCGTRGMLSKLHRLTTPDERGHRTAGSCWHEAMAHYFRTLGDAEGACALFRERYRPFSEEFLTPTKATDGTEYESRLRYDNISLIVAEWFARNPIDSLPYEVIPELVEIPFQLPLDPDGSIVMRGILDAVVRDKTTKRLRVVDHKSTGHMTKPWWNKWVLESGLSEYAWAAGQQIGESHFDFTVGLDIYVNGVEFAELPIRGRVKKNGEPYTCRTHSGVAYEDCFLEHCTFGLQTYKRTRDNINTWGRNALRLARDFKAACERWPAIEDIGKVDMRGAFHGACMFCDYQQFCTVDRPAHLAQVMLVPSPPSPFERKHPEAPAGE